MLQPQQSKVSASRRSNALKSLFKGLQSRLPLASPQMYARALVFSETKQLQKLNAKSRLEELAAITKKSNPIEYKRLSDKYVRRGVEENRKLQNIKTKKLEELAESAQNRRTELTRRTDQVCGCRSQFDFNSENFRF